MCSIFHQIRQDRTETNKNLLCEDFLPNKLSRGRETVRVREQGRFSSAAQTVWTINISSGCQQLFLSQLRLNLPTGRLLPQNNPQPSSPDSPLCSHRSQTSEQQGHRVSVSGWLHPEKQVKLGFYLFYQCPGSLSYSVSIQKHCTGQKWTLKRFFY